MPKISDAKRAARRDEIIDAALRCFARHGYHGTSMADIITESRLSAGAIYSYFPSKTDLVREVAGRAIGNRQSELALAESQGTLSPVDLVGILVAGLRREPTLEVLIQAWAEAVVDPELRDLITTTLARMRATITDVLERWATEHPARIEEAGVLLAREWAASVAPVVMSLIPGFTLQSVLIEGFDPDAYLAALPRLLPHTTPANP